MAVLIAGSCPSSTSELAEWARTEAQELAEAAGINKGLGFTLQGAVGNVTPSPTGVTATITWTLRARAGAPAGSYQQTILVPTGAWQTGDKTAATEVATSAEAAITRTLRSLPFAVTPRRNEFSQKRNNT